MLRDQAKAFLAHKRIAVAGVSSTQPAEAANGIYKKLRESDYTVYAINPKVNEVEGDPCYPDVKHLPEPVDAVMICTTPQVTEQVVQDCADAGIKWVWMHKSIGDSSSDTAIQFCKEHGIEVIEGGCPLMFVEPVDFAHACMRGVMRTFGRIPK